MDGDLQFILNLLGGPVDAEGLRMILTFGASGLLGIVVCTVIGTIRAARARATHGLRPKGQMPPHLSQSTWRQAGLIAPFFGLLWCVMIGAWYWRADLAIAGLIGFVAGVVFRLVNQEHDPSEQKAEHRDDL